MRSNPRRGRVEQGLTCVELDGSFPCATSGFKSRQFDGGSICTYRYRWPGRNNRWRRHTHHGCIGIYTPHGSSHRIHQVKLAFPDISWVEGIGRFADTRSAPAAHLTLCRGKRNGVILVASGIQFRCCGIGKGNRGNKGNRIVLASRVIGYHQFNGDHRRTRIGHDERCT